MLLLPGQTIPDWAITVTDSTGGGCGIIENLPEEVYHSTRALLGKSSLSTAIDQSGQHFKHWLDSEYVEKRDAEAIIRGKAFHCLSTEPDYFSKRFVFCPDFGSMQSSVNRQRRADWIRDRAKDRIVLKPEWQPSLEGMAASIRHHPKLSKLMLKGKTEVTALWVDPETGIPLKSRADFVSDFTGAYIDLKSAADASLRAFRSAVTKFRYFIQDPMYSRAFQENGINVRNFIFAAVEKEAPYAVGLYQLGDGSRLAGEQLYLAGLRRVKRWCEQNHFPGYNDDNIVDLDISPYEMDQAEKTAEAEAQHYQE